MPTETAGTAMPEAPMTRADRARIVQAHMALLKTEVQQNGEAQRIFYRLILAGAAGIIALRKDLGLSTLVDMAPLILVLALAAVAYWLAETVGMIRLGGSLADAEERLKQIAGEDLISYESKLVEWRRRWPMVRWPMPFGILGSFIALGYWLLYRYLLERSSMRSYPSLSAMLNLSAIVALSFAGVYAIRIVREVAGVRVPPRTDSGVQGVPGGPYRG